MNGQVMLFVVHLLVVLVGISLCSSSVAAPPSGQSAFLNGMHDMEAFDWMKNNIDGCDKGWITDLQAIGTSGSPSPNCHELLGSAGLSVIQRLDPDPGHSLPNPDQIAGFAASFAAFASACSNIHVWIVGNEPNVSVGKSDPDCSSNTYGDTYVAVHRAVHALAGHENDLLLVASNSPYSPGCIHSLRSIISRIQGQGVTPDGFALHAYTRASSGSSLSAGLVTDGARQGDSTIDECPGGATWNDTWYSQFRIYQDYIAVIEAAGLAGKPVFITESGNACEVSPPGNVCYPNEDRGYFQALYAEANSHNQQSQTKIRAITPYRWTANDDGTGRDFEIGSRAALLQDLKKAFALKVQWTQPGCQSGDSCFHDTDCSGNRICDLTNRRCQATTACVSGACPEGSICREPQQDCVPINHGNASIAVSPQPVRPGDNLVFDVSSLSGYTHVGLRVRDALGETNAQYDRYEKIGSTHHWFFRIAAGAPGLNWATFVADPSESTPYGIFYFRVEASADEEASSDDGDFADAGNDAESSVDAGEDPSGEIGGACSCAQAFSLSSIGQVAFWALLGWTFKRRRREQE